MSDGALKRPPSTAETVGDTPPSLVSSMWLPKRTASRLSETVTNRNRGLSVDDQFNLDRFIRAQDTGASFDVALREIQCGRKTSHWIWYVFPQISGLGSSDVSRRYAITSIGEARAYVRHPLLGARLRQITLAALGRHQDGASKLFGVDQIKFQSSMTLFMRAAPDEELFRLSIDLFFQGTTDARTDDLLDED